MLVKLAVSMHRTGVNESNGDWDKDIAIGTGGVSEHANRRSIHSKKLP